MKEWFDLLDTKTSFKDEQNIELKPYQTMWITNFNQNDF